MTQTEDAPVIPLWMAGHAYLTLTPAFGEVRDARSGALLRRTPLCGEREARQLVAAANAALPDWRALGEAARGALLTVLADALAGYTVHFAQLIVQESGVDDEGARAEVAAAVEVLRAASVSAAGGVLAVIAGRPAPLLSFVRLAAPAWRSGAAVVVRPDPRCPSVAVALAELTARCAFPAGVCNVLHGGVAAVDGLRATGAVMSEMSAGDGAQRRAAGAQEAR